MGLQDDSPQKKWICIIKCPCINNHKIDWQPKNKFLHLLPSASKDFIVVSSNNKLLRCFIWIDWNIEIDSTLKIIMLKLNENLNLKIKLSDQKHAGCCHSLK